MKIFFQNSQCSQKVFLKVKTNQYELLSYLSLFSISKGGFWHEFFGFYFWVFLNYGELRESGEFRRIPILRKIVISFRRILILRKIVISKLRRIPIIFFSQRILKLFVNFSLTHELPLSGECKHILRKIVIS